MRRVDEDELLPVLMHTAALWKIAAGKTFFLTGGTGFFGKWLTDTFLFINERLQLQAKLIVLSRNPEAFLQQYPFYRNIPALEYIKGDVLSFTFPDEPVDYIVHAATDASVSLNLFKPLTMFDTIVAGTRHLLEMAKQKKVISFLFTSSGAVYGDQPEHLSHIPESYTGSPNILSGNAAYGEGKRVAEMLCNFYHAQYSVSCKIARCFAFAGPYLPIDSHFAIGNFIRDAIEEKPIVIKGDGSPYRSYLYASDLAIWLWTILFHGKACVPYNVGSDEQVSIEELAHKVRKITARRLDILVMEKRKGSVLRYVPNVDLAKSELGLKPLVNLDEAIFRTYNFYHKKETI